MSPGWCPRYGRFRQDAVHAGARLQPALACRGSVSERIVPRAAVPSPTAACPWLPVRQPRVLPDLQAGRNPTISFLPGLRAGLIPQINAGSVPLPSVPAWLLLQALGEAAAARTQAQGLGETSRAPGSVPVLLRLPVRPEAREGLLVGPSSSPRRPNPIPSLALHHFSLALSQDCCPHWEQRSPAIAEHVPVPREGPGFALWSMALCCLCLAGAGSWGWTGTGSPQAVQSPAIPRGSGADVALPQGALTAPCLCHVYFELQAAVVCALARVTPCWSSEPCV